MVFLMHSLPPIPICRRSARVNAAAAAAKSARSPLPLTPRAAAKRFDSPSSQIRSLLCAGKSETSFITTFLTTRCGNCSKHLWPVNSLRTSSLPYSRLLAPKDGCRPPALPLLRTLGSRLPTRRPHRRPLPPSLLQTGLLSAHSLARFYERRDCCCIGQDRRAMQPLGSDGSVAAKIVFPTLVSLTRGIYPSTRTPLPPLPARVLYNRRRTPIRCQFGPLPQDEADLAPPQKGATCATRYSRVNFLHLSRPIWIHT